MLNRERSLTSAIAQIEAAAKSGKYQCFSFDVFDTLVRRRIAPDGVLSSVGTWLDIETKNRGYQPCCSGLEAYHKTYAALATQNAKSGKDHEVLTADLYRNWIAAIAPSARGDEEWASALKDTMLVHELWSTYLDPQVRAIIEKISAAGIKVILISDMYLGREAVAWLLTENGFAFDQKAIYVSSDYALLKRTGRLFSHIQREIGLDTRQWYHIGDNPISDGVAADKLGIDALVIRDYREVRKLARLEYDFKQLATDPGWAGMICADFCQAAPTETGDCHVAYGRRVLGPIFSSFIHQVAERVKERQIDKVYFLAREGYVLSKIFNAVSPLIFGGNSPQAVYLPVSRLTALRYCSTRIGPREISLALANGPRTIANILSPLCFSREDLERVARRNGFANVDSHLPDDFQSWAPFHRLLEDEEIAKRIASWQPERESMQALLEDAGFFNCSRVAIIDVGWSGQIQESLALGARQTGQCPQIFGFYLGTTLSAHHRKDRGNWIEWIISDACHLDWQAQAAFQFPQAFEAVVRSPHPTVIGFQRNESGSVISVLKEPEAPSRQLELHNEMMLHRFQQGMIEHAKHYANCCQMLKISGHQTKPYAVMMIDRMIRFPAKCEAGWLLALNNASDFGSSDVFTMGSDSAKRKTLFGFPIGFRAAMDRSFWAHGTMALHFGTLGNFLHSVLCDARRIFHRTRALGPNIIYHSYGAPGPSRSQCQARGASVELTDIARAGFERLRRESGGLPHDNISESTCPLTLNEVVIMALCFKLSRLVCRISKRHVITYSGLSGRKFFARWRAARRAR